MKASDVNWLDVFNRNAHQINIGKNTGRKFVASWWLRIDTGYPTHTVNYHLDKLVKQGKLTKETSKNASLYYSK